MKEFTDGQRAPEPLDDDEFEVFDDSDYLYEHWRDERDERSFLDEEHLPNACKTLVCEKCGGVFIGKKERKLCKLCETFKMKV